MHMPNTMFENVWVRVAGHAQMIHQRTGFPWRCFINREGEEINLRDWKVSGPVSPQNLAAGTNADRDPNGLVAWIDFYGDVTIDEDNVAHITVKAVA